MAETTPAAPEAPKTTAEIITGLRAEITAIENKVRTTTVFPYEINLGALMKFAENRINDSDPVIQQLKSNLSPILIAKGITPPTTAREFIRALSALSFPISDKDAADRLQRNLNLIKAVIAMLPSSSPAAAAERSTEFQAVHTQLLNLKGEIKAKDIEGLTKSFEALLAKRNMKDIAEMEGLLAKRFGVEGIGVTLIENIRKLDLANEEVQKRLQNSAKEFGLKEKYPVPSAPNGPSKMAQKVTLGIEKALTKLPPSVFEMFKQWGGMDEQQTITFLGNFIRNLIADFTLFIAPGTIAEQQIRAFGRAMHKENQVIAYTNVKGSAPSAALVAEWTKEFGEWEKYTRLGKNNKIDVAMLSMPTMLMLEDEKSAKEYRDEFAKVKQEIDKRLTAPPAAPTTAPAEAPKKIGGVDFIKGEFVPGETVKEFKYADKTVHIDKKALRVEPDAAEKKYTLRAEGDVEPTGIKLLTPATGEDPKDVQVEISTAAGKTIVKLSDIVGKIDGDRANATRKTKVIIKADKNVELA